MNKDKKQNVIDAALIFFEHLHEDSESPGDYVEMLEVVLEETEIEITATKETM